MLLQILYTHVTLYALFTAISGWPSVYLNGGPSDVEESLTVFAVGGLHRWKRL